MAYKKKIEAELVITAQTEIVFNHGLEQIRPRLSVTNPSNKEVMCEVEYTDENNLTLRFKPAFTGKAIARRH